MRRRAARQAKRSVAGSPLSSYRELLTVADRVWSVWVRAYWGACEMCQAPLHPQDLQCAHGFSRVERSIRFDPDNTFALCSSCHRRHTPPRVDWWDWMPERLQDRAMELPGRVAVRSGAAAFARLKMMSRARGGKLTTLSLQAVVADARQRIEALPGGERKNWASWLYTHHTEKLTRFGA
jgi:hypothetical protein